MAFNGIHKAPNIEPTEFGLFAYAKPTLTKQEHNDERWVRGFSQEYLTRPSYVRNWDETSSTSYVVSDNASDALFIEVKPIFIEVEDYHSTFSLTGEDRFARVLKQLEGVSQKALEYELWNGEIALIEGLPNPYLTKPTVSVIGNGASFSARRALALLEHYIGESSAAGEHGIIHLTRDVFVLMAGNSNIFMHSTGGDHMQTSTGTPVIIGSGYSGDGPHSLINTIAVSSGTATVITSTPHYLANGESVSIQTTAGGTDFDGTFTVAVSNSTTFTFTTTAGNQSATATPGSVQMKGSDSAKWVYATGTVHAHLGESVVVNDNLAQGYNVSGNQNDMRVKATRPAVAYFDDSIHLAVKVDLTV